jgi:hypothetical protein
MVVGIRADNQRSRAGEKYGVWKVMNISTNGEYFNAKLVGMVRVHNIMEESKRDTGGKPSCLRWLENCI